MLHTLKLLKGNLEMLVMSNFGDAGEPSGLPLKRPGKKVGADNPPVNNPDIKAVDLEDTPTIEAIHEEASEQEQDLKQGIVNMDLINNAGTIRPGDQGEAVKELQKFLNKYYDFSLDVHGNFDDTTLGAVKVLQYNARLTTDGIIGPKTKAAMQDKITYEHTVAKKIAQNDPTKLFKADEVTRVELDESVDVAHAKLDSLNLMITRGSEIATAVEGYVNGGDRDQFISDRGGAFGWIREGIGANEFDKQLDDIDGLSETQIKNIRDAIKQVLGGTKKKVSPQVVKDLVVMVTSLAVSSAKTLSLPIFHIFNKFTSKLVNLGVDLKTANSLGAYIESGASEAFDPSREYVLDHGVDALGATEKLKHMLREYGISENEIDSALQGEVGETSDKIRIVVRSFLTHIVGRDLDAITKGSFGAHEKVIYIPLGKKKPLPGNPDITMNTRYLGGDPKYGVSRKIVAKIYDEIKTLDDSLVSMRDVLAKVDTRMEGITYLLGQQTGDYKLARGGNEARRDLIDKSVDSLNAKVDYMDDLADNSKFFDNYTALAEDREFLREYSILTKFNTIDEILHNFPASEQANILLATLDKNSSVEEFKAVLSNNEVSSYLKALSTGNFAQYRRSQLKTESGLNKISVGRGKHGLGVERDTPVDGVLHQMKTNTVDGEKSVLTTIEETLIDNGITTISSADIEAAMRDNWTAVDIEELSGVVANTAKGEGATNDVLTSFAKLATERGDTFMFKTQMNKSISYLDKNGDTHVVEYLYTIYMRPECKNPIIHQDIINVDGKKIENEVPEFDTSVPALITSTIPVWINIDLEGSNPVSEQPQDGGTPTQPGENPRDGATPTNPGATNEGANGTVDPVPGTGGPGDTGSGGIGDGPPTSTPGATNTGSNPTVPETPSTGGSGNTGGSGITNPGGSTPPTPPPAPGG